MSTLAEIEAATDALPQEQKEALLRFLLSRLRPAETPNRKARLVRQGDDLLLEAPSDAPAMTLDQVKRLLADWP